MRLSQHAALFRDGRENRVLVDASPAFETQLPHGFPMLPKRDGLAADVGVRDADVVAVRQLDKDGAEITGIILDAELARPLIDEAGKCAILVENAEQAHPVAADHPLLERQEVTKQRVRIGRHAQRAVRQSISPGRGRRPAKG